MKQIARYGYNDIYYYDDDCYDLFVNDAEECAKSKELSS